MEFIKIQKGNKITRYYVNGTRVDKQRYEEMENSVKQKGFFCFITEKIAERKFRHRKLSYGI